MQGEPPTKANTPTGAVFLSYASQDAQAAQRICEALRADGIEVCFDQSELRGGDAWDESIRDRIKTCALFIPVISANAHARVEGYFRLEWKLAIDRSRRIASKQPFLLPVVIDDTQQADDAIPERFRDLQWTRLRDGQATPAFVERVRLLLSSESSHGAASTRPAAITGSGTVPAITESVRPSWRWRPALLATSALLAMGLMYFLVDKAWLSKRAASSAITTTTSARPQTPSAVPEKTIAVLPFVDMSEKKDQEYFGDGMAEEILDLLSKLPQLTVIGRTSSFQFKGRNADLREIGDKLRAAYVVEGSVRKAGPRIRVTAQLVDTLPEHTFGLIATTATMVTSWRCRTRLRLALLALYNLR
jgi:TolB-like protein